MELKLLNEQGQAAETVQVSDVLFGREYNEEIGRESCRERV